MRPVDLLLKVLLMLALVGGSLSMSAGEAVCVLPNRVVVPMATCGMACCALSKVAGTRCSAPRTAAKSGCCGSVGEPSLSRASARVAEADCRCEFRPKATVSPAVAPVGENAAPIVPAQAILTEVRLPIVAALTLVSEPGIVGSDSGPPPLPLRYRSPGRAPPVRRVLA